MSSKLAEWKFNSLKMRMEVNLQKKIAMETENQNYSGTQRLYALRDLESAANPVSLQVLIATNLVVLRLLS